MEEIVSSSTFETVKVLISLLLIAFSTSIIPLLTSCFTSLISRKTAEDIELQKLSKELMSARNELIVISPVAEFAKYAKKKRVVDALDAKVKQHSNKASSRNFKQKIAVQVVLYAFVFLFTLHLIYTHYGVAVTVVDSRWFYPLNWLISFPGCSSTDQTTGISVQFLMFMVMTVTRFVSLKSVL